MKRLNKRRHQPRHPGWLPRWCNFFLNSLFLIGLVWNRGYPCKLWSKCAKLSYKYILQQLLEEVSSAKCLCTIKASLLSQHGLMQQLKMNDWHRRWFLIASRFWKLGKRFFWSVKQHGEGFFFLLKAGPLTYLRFVWTPKTIRGTLQWVSTWVEGLVVENTSGKLKLIVGYYQIKL